MDMSDDGLDNRRRATGAAGNVPELLPEVQVERDHRARLLGGLHTLDNQLCGGFRQRCEDSATMEPADAAGEDRVPVEVAGFEAGGSLVAPILKDLRRPDTLAAIAVDRRDIGASDALVLETLVERPH